MGKFLDRLKNAFIPQTVRYQVGETMSHRPSPRPVASAPDMSSGPMPLIGLRENRYRGSGGNNMPETTQPDTSSGALRAYERDNREEIPVTQRIIQETNDMPFPGTNPRERFSTYVPEGTSAVADSGGNINAFIASISGQGLSTTQILQRARERGIDQDAVLLELTKPRYDPAPYRTPAPGTKGLPMRLSDGSVVESRQPNTMPFPGTNPMRESPPAMSALPRPHVSYVAGRHMTREAPTEGTFPDMVNMPRATPPMIDPLDAYSVNNAEDAYFQEGPFAAPTPPAVAMQAMLADAASRRTGMAAAPVDIRRSDVMVDPPMRRRAPMMSGRRRAMLYGG